MTESKRTVPWRDVFSLALAVFLTGLFVSYLDLLALEYRALAHSLRMLIHSGHVIHQHWSDWGAVAILYGAAPLLIVVLLRRVFALWHRVSPPAPDLHVLARRWKWAVFVGCWVPFLAFSLALSLALTNWLMIDAYWWIQWRETVDRRLFVVAHWGWVLFLPGIWLIGGRLLGRSLWKRVSWKEAGKRRRVARLVALFVFIVPIAHFSVPLFFATAVHAYHAAPAIGSADLLEQRCSRCHDAVVPLAYVRTPDNWKAALEQLDIASKAGLSPDEEKEIVDFLLAARSFPDEWTFRARCQRCHGLETMGWDSRHPDDWEMILERISRYSARYYEPTVRAQVLRHLTADYSDGLEGPGVSGEAYRDVVDSVRSCTACHYYARVAERGEGAKRSKEATRTLVRRMSEKMVKPLAAGEMERIVRGVLYILEDPERMKKLVPHDKPVLKGGLPW